MSELFPRPGKIKKVFAKAASGELVPNNFGSCLLQAVSEGISTKERVARLLDTDVDLIRKVGNNLKSRQIATVAKALINGHP